MQKNALQIVGMGPHALFTILSEMCSCKKKAYLNVLNQNQRHWHTRGRHKLLYQLWKKDFRVLFTTPFMNALMPNKDVLASFPIAWKRRISACDARLSKRRPVILELGLQPASKRRHVTTARCQIFGLGLRSWALRQSAQQLAEKTLPLSARKSSPRFASVAQRLNSIERSRHRSAHTRQLGRC